MKRSDSPGPVDISIAGVKTLVLKSAASAGRSVAGWIQPKASKTGN